MSSTNDESSTLSSTTRTLVNLFKSMHALVPGFVVILAGLWFAAVAVGINSAGFRLVFTVVIVTVVALVVFWKRGFGDAALALVAGLFPALATDWTTPKFVIFCIGWMCLSLTAILLASVRMAASNESIYTAASNATKGSLSSGQLEAVAKADKRGSLGPLEKATAMRIFAYKGLSLEMMTPALDMVSVYSAILGLDYESVSRFVADIANGFGERFVSQYATISERVHEAVRDSQVDPKHYLEAFDSSKRLLLTGFLGQEAYLQGLTEALRLGVRLDELDEYMQRSTVRLRS